MSQIPGGLLASASWFLLPLGSRLHCLVQFLVVVIVPVEGIVHVLSHRRSVIAGSRCPLELLGLLAPLVALTVLWLARGTAAGKERGNGTEQQYPVFHDL